MSDVRTERYRADPIYRQKVREQQALRYANDEAFRATVIAKSKAKRAREAAERNAALGDPAQYIFERAIKGLAKCRDYQARKLRAVPPWANPAAMSEIYRAARLMGEVTGEVFEVDHIVPLRAHLVCGLHCESNLQILPRPLNRAKSNRRWPDMPE